MNTDYIEERVTKEIIELFTFTEHKVKECVYEPTSEGSKCNYVNHQLAEDFFGGVEMSHSAVVIILRIFPQRNEMVAKPIWLPYSQDGKMCHHNHRTVLTSICYHHAENALKEAFNFILEMYKPYGLTAKNMIAYHIGQEKIKSIGELRYEEIKHIEAKLKIEEEEKKLKDMAKVLEEKTKFDPVRYEKENETKAPIVEFGDISRIQEVEFFDAFRSTTKDHELKPTSTIGPETGPIIMTFGDRRCIHTVVNKYGSSCSNTEYTFGAFKDDQKEMPLPAYIVKWKNDTTKILGNICYKHAITLQTSLRMIADHASGDAIKEVRGQSKNRTKVTMDDLHIEIYWDSSGSKPQKYTESEWQIGYEVKPDWKPGDSLGSKWVMKNGEVCFCRFCRKNYFWPRFSYFEKQRESPENDPNEVIEFYLYCCKDCQDEKVTKGCRSCKDKITPANIPSDFSFEYADTYTCSKPECWRCLRCHRPFSNFTEYKQNEKALGLENPYTKDKETQAKAKKLYDDYFYQTRYPDSRFVCRKCCGNRDGW
jgi:hypothetical protein